MTAIDDDLLHRAASGDMDAFEQLIQGYERLIYNITYRMLGNPDDAKDASQEVLIKIYKNLGKCANMKAFKSWIYTVANNTCIDEIRKRKNKAADSLDALFQIEDGEMEKQLPANDPTPEELLLQKEKREILQLAINRLSPEHKALIVLRDIKGLSYGELADATSTSLGTVKSRLSRARSQLCQIIMKIKEQNEI